MLHRLPPSAIDSESTALARSSRRPIEEKRTPESATLQYMEPLIHDGKLSLSLPSHTKLDAKTSCSHTHEKPVWNHALRVSGDCCDTDAGISKMWRFVRLKDTVTEMRSQFALHIRSKLPRALLQDNTFHRKRQRMGLTALRRDKYTELAAVVEENNP